MYNMNIRHILVSSSAKTFRKPFKEKYYHDILVIVAFVLPC